MSPLALVIRVSWIGHIKAQIRFSLEDRQGSKVLTGYTVNTILPR